MNYIECCHVLVLWNKHVIIATYLCVFLVFFTHFCAKAYNPNLSNLLSYDIFPHSFNILTFWAPSFWNSFQSEVLKIPIKLQYWHRLFLMILQLLIFMTSIFEMSIEMNVYALHFLRSEICISVSFTLYFAFTSITFHLQSFPLSWLNIVFWRSSQLLLVLVSPANLVPLADLLSQCSIAFVRIWNRTNIYFSQWNFSLLQSRK